MTEKEQFDSLMNLLMISLQLGQAGVLTPSETSKDAKQIYQEIKDLMSIPNDTISTFKI